MNITTAATETVNVHPPKQEVCKQLILKADPVVEKAGPSFNYDEVVNRFITILEKFENNADSTSEKIFKWGVQIIESALKNPQMDEASFLKNLAQKIEKFKINFDPVNDSSFEGHPSQEFALEVFSLIQEVSVHINKLGLSILSPAGYALTKLPSNQVSVVEPISPEEAFILKWTIEELAKKEKKIAKQKEEKKCLERVLQQVNRAVEASNIRTSAIVEQHKMQVVQHKRELTTRIGEMEKHYAGEITELKTTIVNLEDKYVDDMSRLHNQIDLRDKADEVVAEAIKDQIDSLTQQQEQTVIAVQGKIKNMEETQKYEIYHIKSECQAKLNAQGERIRKLESDLQDAKERNKANEGSNKANTSEVLKLQWQLARAQDELSNSSGFNCVIS